MMFNYSIAFINYRRMNYFTTGHFVSTIPYQSLKGNSYARVNGDMIIRSLARHINSTEDGVTL